MSRLSWRWGALAALLAVLVALPTAVRALPVSSSSVSAAELVRRIRASAAVAWSGYAESTGSLVLPDVRELSGVPALFGGGTRMRAWWRGSTDWRVDTLSLVGETDTVVDGAGSWVWASADRRATRVDGRQDLRLPQSSDLLAPLLGRRLAGSDDVQVSRLPARRVAGRSVPGVRLVPRRPDLTLVAAVDIWAEASTGLPLRVEVTGDGQRGPSLTATVLDLSLQPVSAARTSFEPPPGSEVRLTLAPDVATQVDRFAPYALPSRLGGLARSDRVTSLRGGGVATYGEGLASFAVVPLPRDIAGRVIRALDKAGDGQRSQALTPLVAAVVARVDRRAYLVSGTVPVSLLDSVMAQLRADPPPRRDQP